MIPGLGVTGLPELLMGTHIREGLQQVTQWAAQ